MIDYTIWNIKKDHKNPVGIHLWVNKYMNLYE